MKKLIIFIEDEFYVLIYHIHQILNNVWWPNYWIGCSDSMTKWAGPNAEGIFEAMVPGSYTTIHDGGSQHLTTIIEVQDL